MPDTKNGVFSKLRGDEEHLKKWQLVSEGLAEMFGTAIFVGLGCSSLMTGVQGGDQGVTHLNVVLTFACTLSLVITIFAHISGCHVNPAISLSFVIFGRISIPKFLFYVASQCVGACLGILVVKAISPEECTADSFCVTLPNPHVGAARAMLAEALLTGVVTWVVCALIIDPRCADKHDSAPLKFGFAVVALAIPGVKYAGMSVNPARSFGPALISGNWTQHWVYWLGPMSGSVVFSHIYKTFFLPVAPARPVSTHLPDNQEEHPL